MIVEGGKGRLPQRMRRHHDPHVMKALEAQVPLVGVPRGFPKALQFGIDLVHLHMKAGGKPTLRLVQNIADALGERSPGRPRRPGHLPDA